MSGSINKRIPNWGIGVIALVLVVCGFYLAFAKTLPFSGHGYELRAVFSDAQNVRSNSPVRISGVDVGKVTDVEHLTDAGGNGADAAVVTMELKDTALPIREDATLTLRPRLFLEGNLFVDLQPGSPGAPELHSGSVVPLGQTSISVQLDQVLTSLQKPVRDDLQVFLKEFGDGLDRYGGAEGFRESFRTSPAAYRYTSQVNEALLGTQPGDLAGVVVNFDKVAAALVRNRTELQDLVTNLSTVTGSFAAEDQALEQAIAELPRVLSVGRPTLAKLNSDFPALRAFSREALPGVRSANTMLDDATPWIGQLRKLVSGKELRGLVADLRPTIPALARLSNRTIPFLEQGRALASCFNNVVIPWSNSPVPSSDGEPNDPVYKQTGYGLVGIAGESRSGDANGQYIRVAAGGGSNTIVTPPIPGINGPGGAAPSVGTLFAPLLGAEPAAVGNPDLGSPEPYIKTPFHPNDPCENQDPPNLNSSVASVPGQSSASQDQAGTLPTQLQPFATAQGEILQQLTKARELQRSGHKAEGDALQRQAIAALERFFKTQIPKYQAASRGVGG